MRSVSAGRKKSLDFYEGLRIRYLHYEGFRRTMKMPIQPTSSELAILDVLWDRKRATVREVFEELSRRKKTTYTTVLKLMQIMQEKALVERDESERAHVYRAIHSRRKTRQGLVAALVERAFQGSALNLVQHVLEAKPATEDELEAIRKMIDEAEARGRNSK